MEVSVVVTTYNRACMVAEAIDSILRQTFEDFELIVVDNFSTDNTEDIIKTYTDKRIRYFRHQNNGLIAVNRNYGIKQAQGEYIAFCDDDDLWYPEKLDRCLNSLRQDKDIILVCHDVNVIYKGGAIRVDICGPYVEPMYYRLLFQDNCVFTSAVIARRDRLLAVDGFNERPDFAGVEDYDLWMRLAKVGKFYFLHETLGEYRVHENTYTYDIEKRTRHLLNVVEHHFSQFSPNELKKCEKEIKKRKADIFFGGGWRNLLRKDFARAKAWFKDGIKANPFELRNYIGFILGLLTVCPPPWSVRVAKFVTGK